jgi:hypothetical protein
MANYFVILGLPFDGATCSADQQPFL